jgi:hypothetical protein
MNASALLAAIDKGQAFNHPKAFAIKSLNISELSYFKTISFTLTSENIEIKIKSLCCKQHGKISYALTSRKRPYMSC